MDPSVHLLNALIVDPLVEAYRMFGVGKPFEKRVLLAGEGWTPSHYTNFCKLGYFNLMQEYLTEENKKKKGFWVVTGYGGRFVAGTDDCPVQVWTFNRGIVKFSDKRIFIGDVTKKILYRGDHAELARAGRTIGKDGKAGQREMF